MLYLKKKRDESLKHEMWMDSLQDGLLKLYENLEEEELLVPEVFG
jgi:hypothetical protein